MATKKFQASIFAVANAAFAVIKEEVKKKKKIVFADRDAEDFDPYDDSFTELPTITYVDKYYGYYQYAVLSLKFVKGKVIMDMMDRGEDGQDKTMELDEVNSADWLSICEIADLIKK